MLLRCQYIRRQDIINQAILAIKEITNNILPIYDECVPEIYFVGVRTGVTPKSVGISTQTHR